MKNIKQKLFVIILFLVTVLAFAACGRAGEVETPAEIPTAEIPVADNNVVEESEIPAAVNETTPANEVGEIPIDDDTVEDYESVSSVPEDIEHEEDSGQNEGEDYEQENFAPDNYSYEEELSQSDADETATEEIPEEETTAEEIPEDELPSDDIPTEEIPTDETTAEELPPPIPAFLPGVFALENELMGALTIVFTEHDTFSIVFPLDSLEIGIDISGDITLDGVYFVNQEAQTITLSVDESDIVNIARNLMDTLLEQILGGELDALESDDNFDAAFLMLMLTMMEPMFEEIVSDMVGDFLQMDLRIDGGRLYDDENGMVFVRR